MRITPTQSDLGRGFSLQSLGSVGAATAPGEYDMSNSYYFAPSDKRLRSVLVTDRFT
jgi:hypothetical protein